MGDAGRRWKTSPAEMGDARGDLSGSGCTRDSPSMGEAPLGCSGSPQFPRNEPPVPRNELPVPQVWGAGRAPPGWIPPGIPSPKLGRKKIRITPKQGHARVGCSKREVFSVPDRAGLTGTVLGKGSSGVREPPEIRRFPFPREQGVPCPLSQRLDPDPGWKSRRAPPGAACPPQPEGAWAVTQSENRVPPCRDMGRVVMAVGIKL